MNSSTRAFAAFVLASAMTALAACSGGDTAPRVLDPGSAAPTTAPTTAGTATTAPTTAASGSATTAATTTPTTAPSGTATTAPTTAPTGTGTTSAPTTAPSGVATTSPSSVPTSTTTSPPASTAPTTAPTTGATVAPSTAPSAVSMSAVCPPTTIPTPVSTTVAFPAGSGGGTVANPDWYDSSGTTMFPANNAATGTTLTIKIGGTNYDSFAAGSQGGTTLVYIDSSTTSSQAISFNGTSKAVVIAATSPSCFTSAHTYYMDVDVSGLNLAHPTGVASGTNGETQTFSITTAANQFPTGTVQLTINQE